MIKSMTGYGKAITDNEKLSVTVEIKTLNSKFFDLNLKTGNAFPEKELEIRNLIQQSLERGKISFNLSYVSKNPDINQLKINLPVARAYHNTLMEVARKVKAEHSGDVFRMVMNYPEVYIKEDNGELLKEDWEEVKSTIQAALQACNDFRSSEGQALEADLKNSVGNIRKYLKEVDQYDPQRLENVRKKVRNQIKEFIDNEKFDSNRFEQELIYYTEKLDINEEKVRLNKHLEYFEETLAKSDANGKKLGFISQEIGREINTIGSKANDANIQKLVVKMKDELEKVKEQSLNVL